MRMSFNLWPFCSFPSWLPAYTIEDTIERLAKIGYDGVEVCAAAPQAWPPYLNKQRRREIGELLTRHNMAVSSICPALGGGPGLNPASSFEQERHEAVKHYQDCIDLASEWDAPVLLYVVGWKIHGVPLQEAWNQALKTAIEVGKYAEERDIMLAIEPTSADTNIIDTADQALEFAAETGLSNARFMLDTFHTQFRQDIAADYARVMGDKLVHMHISDYDRLAPGQGGYDFKPLIDTLKEIRYEGFLCIECGIREREVDPESIARMGLEHMRSLV